MSHLRVTDVIPERAKKLASEFDTAETVASFEALLASDVDAVAIFTQRWTHGPLVVQALQAGKHVYSAVPMAVELTEIEQIIAEVERTGLTYMMGETSYYNPATFYIRQRLQRGDLGRVFYSEGDYVHDMELGFYAAYQYSGGENWKATASFPPMLYPTHAIEACWRSARAGSECQLPRCGRRSGRRCLRPRGQRVQEQLLERLSSL